MNNEAAGILYICATPIGNLGDMTFRAIEVLKGAAIIAAEDTRHTRKLLSHFDIHTPLVSYHEHNKAVVGQALTERLLAGETVVVVSDAGMPGISDPGADIVASAIEAGIQVVPVPGANAALCGLVGSGLDTRTFTFIGFPPKTSKKRRELFRQLADYPYTMIFYEAPHRLRATLAEMGDCFGDRKAVVARELTKKFEQFLRGTLKTLSEHFDKQEPRGECTLIVAGCEQEQAVSDETGGIPPAEAVAALVVDGMNKKDAIRRVASDRGLSKRDVYNAVLDSQLDEVT